MDAKATLHPRPRLTRPGWVDLCGTWRFAFDDAGVGLDQRWQDDATRFDRDIVVPFPPEAEMSGIGDKGFHPVLWYRREFDAVADDGRLLLHFGAVDYIAHVWVNGDLAASHEGGHTPFTADITASLRPDGPQVVVVRAEDQPEDATQPRGKQDWQRQPHAIFYDRTSGIWQPVWLEPVPQTHIVDLQLTPDIATGTVIVELKLNRSSESLVRLELSLRGQQLAVAAAGILGRSGRVIVDIPASHHGMDRNDLYWTPDSPNLIDVSATLCDSAMSVLDEVRSYFGLRSVGVDRGRFLLNDRPIFMRSVLEQGYWPQSHLAAPDAEALRREVELIKSLGFNAVRIHQKTEDPRFLYWCDRIGLMVWGETANAYVFNPTAVSRLTHEWLEIVERDRSHPCIVTWVPINESWGVTDIALRADEQAFATSLYHLTKAVDPTRPVISNDGWEHTISDIVGVHDYAPDKAQLLDRYGTAEAMADTLTGSRPWRRRILLDLASAKGAPVMITEFGGFSMEPKKGEAWFGYETADSAEAYLEKLRNAFNAIYDSEEIVGLCYTQLTDTLQETNGLVDANRVPKLPIEELRSIIMRPSTSIPSEAADIARQRALRISRSVDN